MKQIEEIIRNTTEEEQEKVDWTKEWRTKYPVQEDYNYSEQDAMLVLKDILVHEYMDNRPKKNKKHK